MIDCLDWSFYQKYVKFEKLKGALVEGRPVRRAFVRAGQGTRTDTFFGRNWNGLGELGWLRGSYWVSDPGVNGAAQARAYWDVVKRDAGDYRVVADLELPRYPSLINKQNHWGFVAELEQVAGHTPIIYSRASWLDLIYQNEDYSRFAFWGAGYPKMYIPKGWVKAAMHQYSHRGRMPGIDGDVDLNYILDEAALLRPAARPRQELPTSYPAIARAPTGLYALSGTMERAGVLFEARVNGVECVVHEVNGDWATVSLKDLQGFVKLSELVFEPVAKPEPTEPTEEVKP